MSDAFVTRIHAVNFRHNGNDHSGGPLANCPRCAVDALLAAASVSAGEDDEWCPGHGSFSERRLKSDCVICRGEYMPEQTVSAGADDLAGSGHERPRRLLERP